MNYLRIYYKLVNSRKRMIRDCYLEKHHIVPKSVYGKGYMDESSLTDVEDESNIVFLTGREHFVAHWLLHKAFPGVRNFSAAFHAMASMSNKYHRRYTPSSRAIEEARRAHTESMQEAVAMYSLNGELIKVFSSTDEAANELNVEKSNISAACSSRNKYVNNVKGFLWRRFDKEPLKKIDEYSNRNEESKLKVHEYDNLGNYLKTYFSIREAGRNGVERGALKRTNRNKPIFSKEKWYIISNLEAEPVITISKSNTQRRKVHQIDLNTGKIIKTWNSTREPQRILGISNVADVCNGKRKTMGGYIWKFAEQEYELDITHHKRKHPNAKKISILINGKTIGVFDSLREAELKTQIPRHKISKLLKNEKEIDGIKVVYYDTKD